MCLQYLGIPSLLQTACLRFPALPSEFNLQVEVHQFYLRGFYRITGEVGINGSLQEQVFNLSFQGP